MNASNMMPADELLWIKQKKAELETREKEIKSDIKAGLCPAVGEFAIALLAKRKTNRFDRKAAEEELGDLSRFEVHGKTVVLKVEELVNPES
ncbi:hypothetical protein [Halovulum sp. GXIMD14793]